MPRGLRCAVVAMAAAFGGADVADAQLRSPRLSSTCASGYTYEEELVGPFRVEGCHDEVNAQSGESERHRFKGVVEVNGMLVRGSQDVIVTTKRKLLAPPGSVRPRKAGGTVSFAATFRLTRGGNASIDLEGPAPGGGRRSNVIYRGAVELEASGPEAVQPSRIYEVDVPVDSGSTLLGMRLRDDIEGAELTPGGTETGGGGPGPTVRNVRGKLNFRADLSFASSAPSLLRDWTAPTSFELLDGEGLVTTASPPRFRINTIVIPGIGGFKNLSIVYDPVRDEWDGSVDLDMGELFPLIDFEMSVNARTGAINRIATTASNLSIPIGSTGITLRELRGSFEFSPFVLGAGLTATYGPRFGNFFLVEMSGDLEVRFEPNFRLEVTGSARVFPTGPNDQIARGSSEIVLDSGGYISVAADARIALLVAGIGASAQVSGSGAYATDRNRFNIQAGLRGTIHAGFLGDFDVVRLKAVVSSEGWGTCGELAGFIRAGVGQEWGRNPDVFLSCDLSDYRAPVGGGRAAAAGRRTFTVARGTKKIGIEITGAAAEPRAQVVAPNGQPVIATTPTGVRQEGDAAVVARPGQARQLVVVRNPRAGRWTVRWGAAGPEVTGIRVARDLAPLRARLAVRRGGRPGLRRLAVSRLTGLAADEKVQIGIRTPRGIVPVGDATGGSLNADFAEQERGLRQVVATVSRNGIPNPERSVVLGSYAATLPDRPSRVDVRVSKSVATLRALAVPDSELPDAWQYVLRSSERPFAAARAKPGAAVKLAIPAGTSNVTVAVRPVVRGRVLPGAVLAAKVGARG